MAMKLDGLSISKVKVIMHKTKELQDKMSGDRSPDQVVIIFENDQFTVRSFYVNGKCKVIRSNERYYPSLDEYVFRKDFSHGNVLLDLMQHEQGNLYQFEVEDFRNKNDLKGKDFSLGFLGNGEFFINVYEKEW